MELINELLKAALLGSEKTDVKQFFTLLPENIQQKLALLEAENTEEAFLQLSAFVLPYYQAGKEFSKVEMRLEPAQEETSSQAPEKVSKLLRRILNENRHLLINVWLKTCADHGYILSPEFLPQLLDLSKENVTLQYLLKRVMGERGKWLTGLQQDWQIISQTAQEIWETGKAVQRKQLFAYLLQNDLPQAKNLLLNTWKQESAADRVDFLTAWANFLTAEDVEFLEAAQQDKSAKVKTLALQLLLKQPKSLISKEIREHCHNLFALKDGGIFGMGQKNIVVNPDISLLPLIEKLELEKESLQKTFSDREYQILQLLSLINPSFWEEELGLTAEKIIKQFINGKALKKYVPAFAKAIILHQNPNWAAAWLQQIPAAEIQYEHIQDDTFLLLSIAPQEILSVFFENKQITNLVNPINLINLAGNFDFPWSLNFSKLVLKTLYQIHADRGVYHYEMAKFMELSMLLHPDILKDKDSFLPSQQEKRETWRTMIEDLFRNIELKTKIQASFDA